MNNTVRTSGLGGDGLFFTVSIQYIRAYANRVFQRKRNRCRAAATKKAQAIRALMVNTRGARDRSRRQEKQTHAHEHNRHRIACTLIDLRHTVSHSRRSRANNLIMGNVCKHTPGSVYQNIHFPNSECTVHWVGNN